MMADHESQVEAQPWEREVLCRHRWGQHGERAAEEELARLRPLWGAAQPIGAPFDAILNGILSLEICNWNLEESVLALCRAIGAGEPPALPIGHMASMAPDRWRQVWAYYLGLRGWLSRGRPAGFAAMQSLCDPNRATAGRVDAMLGERDELKELYVERTCLCLEFWLRFLLTAPQDAPERLSHRATVAAVEQDIKARDPDGEILKAFRHEGDGRLEPCHHKVLRRYDIIISSIGAGAWRGAISMRGTDGFERADTVEALLAPVRTWLEGRPPTEHVGGEQRSAQVQALLGEPDPPKRFMASLLVSLLQAQALAARKKAQSRAT